MDYSSPASSVNGISQARILEWVVLSFSRESSQLKDWTSTPVLEAEFFTPEPPGKPNVDYLCRNLIRNHVERMRRPWYSGDSRKERHRLIMTVVENHVKFLKLLTANHIYRQYMSISATWFFNLNISIISKIAKLLNEFREGPIFRK